MNIIGSSTLAGAALLAITATASAGPMSVASSTLVAPPQTQVVQIHYRRWRHHHHHYWHRHHYWHHHHWRRYGHYGWNPGAAVAGTALGLMALPLWAATGGGCDPYYYGSCYYGGYGWPYSYGYYGAPYYRRYGYWHGPRFAGYGGVHTGRSVGHGGGWHGGGWHGGHHR